MLFLSGCGYTAKDLDLVLKSNVNRSVQHLLKMYGYPNKIIKAPENSDNKVYIYTYDKKCKNGYYTISGNLYGGGTYHYYCTYYFTVNRNNIVIMYTYRGNNCHN